MAASGLLFRCAMTHQRASPRRFPSLRTLLAFGLALSFVSACGSTAAPSRAFVRGKYDEHGIAYYGGWVMGGDLRVHLIFTGKWDPVRQGDIVAFINSLSGTSWAAILSTYHDDRGAIPSGHLAVTAISEIDATPSSRSELEQLLQAYPNRIDTLYVVLAAAGDQLAGIGDGVHGYHSVSSLNAVTFAAVPDANDATFSYTLAHELAESVVNPVPDTGWLHPYDTGYRDEIADLCAFEPVAQFGRWILPSLWVNEGPGRCDTRK